MTGPTSTRDARRPVSEEIFDALRAEILAGRLVEGDPIPSERVLAEQHGVNRHAVREAVKRLQQSGLVEVSQGGATRVLDWRERGGLDLLAELPIESAGAAVIRSILEMRLCIGVDAARRCAERAPAPLLAELQALAAQALATSAPEPREQAYRELWSRIVDGADNLAFRLSLNALVAGIDRRYEPMLALLADELADDDAIAALPHTIADRDPDAAQACAERLLTKTLNAALSAAPTPETR